MRQKHVGLKRQFSAGVSLSSLESHVLPGLHRLICELSEQEGSQAPRRAGSELEAIASLESSRQCHSHESAARLGAKLLDRRQWDTRKMRRIGLAFRVKTRTLGESSTPELDSRRRFASRGARRPARKRVRTDDGTSSVRLPATVVPRCDVSGQQPWHCALLRTCAGATSG